MSVSASVHEITPYLKNIEAFMSVKYPLTQLLRECANWKLPNYCHWEAI